MLIRADAQELTTALAAEPQLPADIALHLAQLTTPERVALLTAHNLQRQTAGLPPQTALPMPGNAGQVILVDQNDEQMQNGLRAILELEGQTHGFDLPANILVPQNGTDNNVVDDGEAGEAYRALAPPALLVDANRRHINPEHWQENYDQFESLGKTRLTALFLQDLRLWKKARAGLRELYITTMVAIPQFKKEMGIRFAVAYKELTEAFLFADREPEQSMILFSVQIFTVPSIAALLVSEYNFMTTLLAVCYTYYSQHKIGHPYEVDVNAKQLDDVYAFRSSRHYHIVNDLRYLLCTGAVQRLIPAMPAVHLQFIDWLELFQGQNPQQKSIRYHVEYESDSWRSAFNVTMQIAKHTQMFARTFEFANCESSASGPLRTILGICVDRLRRWDAGEHRNCRPAFEPRAQADNYISFHHPLHWLLVGLSSYLTEHDSLKFLHEPGSDCAEVMKVAQYPLRVLHMMWEIRCNLWVRNGHSIRVQLYYYTDVDSREYCVDKDLQFVQLLLASVGPSTRFGAAARQWTDNTTQTTQYIEQFSRHDDVVKAMFGIFKSVPDASWMGEDMSSIHMQAYMFHFFITVFSERSWLLRCSNEENIARALRHGLVFGGKTYSELSKMVNDDRGDEACFDKVVKSLTDYTPPSGLEDVGRFVLKDAEYEHIDPYYFHYSLQQIEEATEILAKKKGMPNTVLERSLEPIDLMPWNGLVDFVCCPTIQDYILQYFASLRRHAALDPKVATSREGVTDKILQLLLLVLQEERGRRSRGAVSFNWGVFPLKCADYLLQKDVLEDVHLRPHRAKISLFVSRLTQLNGEGGPVDLPPKSPNKRELSVDNEDTNRSEVFRKKAFAKARQEKLLREMRASQDAFIKQNDTEDFDTTDMDGSASRLSNQDTEWHYPSGNCIICQNAVATDGATYGVLSCIQASRLDRPAPINSHYKQSLQDLVSHPLSMDQYLDWQPDGLANFPVGQTKTRDTITTCGHIMHWLCYEEFLSAVRDEHARGVSQGRNLSDRVELQCPLCQTVGNTMLSVLSKTQSLCSVETLAPTAPYDLLWLRGEDCWYNGMLIDHYQAAEHLTQSMRNDRQFVERVDALSLHSRSRNKHVHQDLETVAAWEERKNCFADLQDALEEFSSEGKRQHNYGFDHLTDAAMLSTEQLRVLAASIVDIEVALRDRTHNDNNTASINTLVEGLSDQNLVSLRCQANGFRGRLALLLYNLTSDGIDYEDSFSTIVSIRLRYRFTQLFHSSPEMKVWLGRGRNSNDDVPLFLEDIFAVFVEMSMIYVNGKHRAHLANLYLEAEIVKALMLYAPGLREDHVVDGLDVNEPPNASLDLLNRFWETHIPASYNPPPSSKQVSVLYKILQQFALAFVRKYAIFAFAVLGVRFPSEPTSHHGTELDRLSDLLKLHSLDDVLRGASHSGSTAGSYRSITYSRWLNEISPQHRSTLKLSWPLPIALTPLPDSLDVLLERCLYFICPRCQTNPRQPALCLLCGAMLCFQSQCCWYEGVGAGECAAHRTECGGSVGLFLVIKRSTLLVTRGNLGAFGPTPYLDVHGEQDPDLRRGKPQFLNRKRYEAGVRQLYLQHRIPTHLVRKVEVAEDMGGWETL